MADEVDEEIALLERKKAALLSRQGSARVGVASTINSFGQGLGLGFSDELAAGLKAGVTAPFSPRTFGDIYKEQLGTETANLAASREKYPKLSTAMEVAGGVTSGIGLLRGAAALPALGRFVARAPALARLIGLGAAEGGVYGAGSANTSGVSRTRGAATGAAIGAVAAPIGDLVARGIGKGVRSGAGLLGRALSNTPERQAERVISRAVQADELGESSIRSELKRLGPQARVADLGENLSSLAREVTARPGQGRTLAASILNDRQATQQNRLLSAAGFKGNLDDFQKSFRELMASRISVADPLYKEAYEQPLTITDKLRELVNRPSLAAAMKRAVTKIKDEPNYRGQLHLFQVAKEELDDQIGTALRSGSRNEARRLTLLKGELLSELDSQIPSYKAARELFSGEAAMRDAANLGRSLLTTRVDLDAAEMAVDAMTAGERQSFQIGALRGMIDKLESTPQNRNVAGRLVESTRARDILRLAFPTSERFRQFVETAEAESQFAFTRNRVLGGSPTARILEGGADLDQNIGIMAQLASGRDPVAVGIQLISKLGLGKASPETLEEISRILFSRDLPARQVQRMTPQIATPIIAPLTRQAGVTGGVNALVASGNADTRNSLP